MNDPRLAFRMLLKNPGFTAVAVLTLALAIGANTAIFSFLDRVFWRPLPAEKPQELVMVKYQTQTGYQGDAFVYPLYVNLRDQSQEVFSGLIAYWLTLANLIIGDGGAEVPAMAVSSEYFSVLGVKPALGRTFLPEEDRVPGAHPVAVISHELWQRRMGGDPAVLGQTIRLNDQSLTVVGVAASDFTGTYAGVGPAVYVPLATWAHIKGISLEERTYDWLNLLGRLKPGVSPERAQAVLRILAERIHAETPLNTPTGIFLADGSRGTNVWTEENLWGPFALVQVVTALVLLIACANVMNLLLARGATRRRELAIRVAIGARRRDVIGQLLIESTLLALASGACGILLARWSMQGLRSAVTIASVANIPVELDGRILLFALGASLATALACGLVPALRASRPDLVSALNEGSGFIPVLTRRWHLRNLLAQQFWPNKDPIGKRVTFDAEVREVIGVVKAFKLQSIREDPAPLSFWPLDQPMQGTLVTDAKPVLVVRAAADPKPIVSVLRAELRPAGFGPGGFEVATLTDRISVLLMPQRMIGAVLNVLGLVGLLFAGTGVFAVMAYEVSQRTREIGIRMALGAQFGEVLGWILRRGAALAMMGIGLGLALSVVPMGLLEAFIPEIRRTDRYFLYGVHTWDLLTYAVAGGVVMAVGLAACWLPAWRAAKIDPMTALRCE